MYLYNIVPPKFYIKNKHKYNQKYPFLGSNNERLIYTKYFNDKLKQLCQENNFIFIDIYKHYSTEDGYLLESKSDNSVHIIDGQYLFNYLVNEIKIIK